MKRRWKNKPEYIRKVFMIGKDIYPIFEEASKEQGITPNEMVRVLIARTVENHLQLKRLTNA